MKALVLGIGNPILSDDGVGIKIAREIKKCIGNVDVAEINARGISILDYIRGYNKVIIIDSVYPARKGLSNGVKSQDIPPGTIKEFNIKVIEKSYPFLSHGINIPLAIEFGKQCGEDIPEIIKIYGIGTKDTTTFSESCTKEVEEAIPNIVDYIINKEFQDVKT